MCVYGPLASWWGSFLTTMIAGLLEGCFSTWDCLLEWQCMQCVTDKVDGWGHSQNLLCSKSTSEDLSHHQSSHPSAKSWWARSGGQGLTEDGGWWAASVDTSWHSGGPTSPLHPWAHGGPPTHPATRSYHEVEHPSSRNTNIRPLSLNLQTCPLVLFSHPYIHTACFQHFFALLCNLFNSSSLLNISKLSDACVLQFWLQLGLLCLMCIFNYIRLFKQ